MLTCICDPLVFSAMNHAKLDLCKSVTYWPSTEPSITRCTCFAVTQVHPVEDIGISSWPVDVVEFSAYVYAHRKQVGIRQLYNQVPQMVWGSSSCSCSWSQLETRCRSGNQFQTEGLGPQWLMVEQPSQNAKEVLL